MALFGLRMNKKERAGLFMDGGIFRYLSIMGKQDEYTVTKSFAGLLTKDAASGGEPFVNSGMYIYQMFDEIASKIGGFNVPINIAIPTTDSLLRIVSMPGMSLGEARLAFRYQFENFFPFPVDEGIYDFAEIDFPLQNGEEEKRFLVVATRMLLIKNIMDAASAHGIEVNSIEPTQIALERAVTPVITSSDAAVYIYAGNRRSCLILSWKGNGVFYRTMSLGFQKPEVPDTDPDSEIYDSESEESNTDYSTFVKEVRSSFQFAISQIRGFEPDTISIFGPGASIELSLLIKEFLSVPSVVCVDPVAIHGLSFDSSTANWEIPLGLALR